MQHQKAIVYDRETRDFALYLNGELVGFARTYQEGEATLDALITERLERAASEAAQARPAA